MSDRPKAERSPDEVFDALDRAPDLDEIAEEIDGMTDQEVARALAKAGFERDARRGVVVRLGGTAAAAAVTACAAAAAIAIWARSGSGHLGPDPVASAGFRDPSHVEVAGPGDPEARNRRERAVKACEEKRFLACEELLDAAKAVDPTGEDAPEVVALRRRIAADPEVKRRAALGPDASHVERLK